MMPSVKSEPNQWYLRILILAAIAVSIGFTWLVWAAGALRPNLVNLLTQALTVAVIVSLMWLVIRRFKQTRARMAQARANAEAEAKLLRDRSAFIYSASDKLSSKLASFEKAIAGLDESDKRVPPLRKSTAELRKLLDRLETISTLEASMALTSGVVVSVSEVLGDLVTTWQPKFTEVGATVNLTGSGEPQIVTDEHSLREIFDSIIDNAAAYMPKTDGKLDINYVVKRRNVVVTFADNGKGIDASKQQQLFQPFSRADGVMEFNHKGQGLSLYIDKLCVESMGGSIALASEPKVGTAVTLTLPLGDAKSKASRKRK